MFRIHSFLGNMSRHGRLAVWVVVLGCAGLSGCCQWPNLMGPHFQHDEFFESGQKLRKPDRDNEFFGASNKAREIESNLGVSGD